MSNPRENPRLILKLLEQRARKRFGQNFLARADIVARMVRGARITKGDKVVEVGPGLGILTEELLRVGAELTAVELDRDLAEYIRGQFGDQMRLVEGDAMRQDWRTLCEGGGWKMVANLPYNIGTQLLMGALQLPDVFATVTVMLQHEVVARIVAEPGGKSYGALSVRAQVRGRARYLLPVPPESFHPPPKVNSAVLHVELFDKPDVPVEPAAFDRVVKSAFSQRRKFVSNSLGALYGKDEAREALASCGIDADQRAESLSVDDYRALSVELEGTP